MFFAEKKNLKNELILKLGDIKMDFFTKAIVWLDIKVFLQYGCEQPRLEASSHLFQ